MIDDLFALSQSFLRLRNRSFQRYFLKSHPLSSRFSLIVGQRGVGKTTVIIQHILATYSDLFTPRALYVQTDHFRVASRSLYDIAEEFNNLGEVTTCITGRHRAGLRSKLISCLFGGRTLSQSRQSPAPRSGMTGAKDCALWRSSKGCNAALSFTLTDR